MVGCSRRCNMWVYSGDRQAIGANNKGSWPWGILDRLDLCSPGLRFRRIFRPREWYDFAKIIKCVKMGRILCKSMEMLNISKVKSGNQMIVVEKLDFYPGKVMRAYQGCSKRFP